MRMRSTPGYRDLFGGTATLEELLAKIPSDVVIKIISWLNAQFLHTSAPVERDQELRGEATRSLSKLQIAELGERLVQHTGFGKDRRVFHSLYLTYFLHYELTHFRDIPPIPIGAEEELHIFKAYLVVVDMFNDGLTIPEVDLDLPDEEFFSQRTWPMLFKQHEFNRDVDPIFELTRLYLLLDELQKSRYAEYVKEYCQRLNCNDGFQLVGKFLGVVRVSNKSNDGKSRVHRLETVPEEYHALLDLLSHPTATEGTTWEPRSLKSLKQYPLYRSGRGEYHVLNWNFFYRSAYQAILRDFYTKSGIASEFPEYGNFKRWVGFEVTEKRFLRTMLEMIYSPASETPVFPGARSEEKPDACVRHGRYIVMLECKDTDVPDSYQSEFDYGGFIKELRKKHVANSGGSPKSLLQLSRNAKDFMTGKFPVEFYGSRKPKNMWVLPVLVCDGYLYSAPGVNEILNRLYETNRATKTAPVVVLTLEYLFRKMVDLQGIGLAGIFQEYQAVRSRRLKRFRKAPTPEGAFEAFASIEEVCRVKQLPYKAQPRFIREFFAKLGLPTGLKDEVKQDAPLP